MDDWCIQSLETFSGRRGTVGGQSWQIITLTSISGHPSSTSLKLTAQSSELQSSSQGVEFFTCKLQLAAAENLRNPKLFSGIVPSLRPLGTSVASRLSDVVPAHLSDLSCMMQTFKTYDLSPDNEVIQ
jgi:hypothetical protein